MALTAARESSGGLAGKTCGGDGGGGGEERQREHMFDKVVTPSDVGKLNRLVVPKHFAERYFPLGPAAARAGAVLRFEDTRGCGKEWRFRLSYWSSSQSYVMTKGWSGFVRDRRLAAGDTVSFFRAGARLFIDCRRRGGSAPTAATPVVPVAPRAVAVQRTSDEPRGRLPPAIRRRPRARRRAAAAPAGIAASFEEMTTN